MSKDSFKLPHGAEIITFQMNDCSQGGETRIPGDMDAIFHTAFSFQNIYLLMSDCHMTRNWSEVLIVSQRQRQRETQRENENDIKQHPWCFSKVER